MKSRWFPALVAILGLVLFSSLSAPVAAATPTVQLVLGGTGATPWAIGSIAPGNSGTNTVTLSNTGYEDGVVTIWISEIVNSEGTHPESETGDTAEPGELGDYLILNVSGTNLSTDITLPAKIDSFPQSAADTKHIYINPLGAFSTLNLQWEWRLPLETGNDVQGDGLSFTINYMLEEFPPLPTAPSPPLQSAPSPPLPTTPSAPLLTTPIPPLPTTPSAPHLTTPTPLLPTTPSPWLPTTPAPQLAPANFEVRNLTISPVQVKPGESISINCDVINTGGQSGEYTLEISIPGMLQTSRLIKLEAGQTQAVNLKLPARNPGTYQVDIGGLKGTVTIGTLPPLLPVPSWIQKIMSVWLIPTIFVVIGTAALVFIVIIIMRKRLRWEWIPYIFPRGSVNVLAQTAAQRILYATRHQKRVIELASAIAREMDLSKNLIKMLLTVGIIYDPGSVKLPYPVAQTALQYHERLNGSGYPQKLTGDDIILEARILAVADMVETMADTVKTSSSKPYRSATGMDKTLKKIKRNSSIYDSEVIKAFVRLVERGKFRFQTHYD